MYLPVGTSDYPVNALSPVVIETRKTVRLSIWSKISINVKIQQPKGLFTRNVNRSGKHSDVVTTDTMLN